MPVQGNLDSQSNPGSTISTLLHDKINPKKFQVLSLGDTGFLQFFRVVLRDYGKPRNQNTFEVIHLRRKNKKTSGCWNDFA